MTDGRDDMVTTDRRKAIDRLRIDADPESVEKGLVTLVLTLVELLRQLMERQALRRVEQGSLTDDQIEKVGSTLMALEARMAELQPLRGAAAGALVRTGWLGCARPATRSLHWATRAIHARAAHGSLHRRATPQSDHPR